MSDSITSAPLDAAALARRCCFFGQSTDSGTRERILAAVTAYAERVLAHDGLRFEPLRPGGLTDEQWLAFAAAVRERVEHEAIEAQIEEFAKFEARKNLGPRAC